ncbi:VOC family protein [Nocardiopsis sp. NPDC101807]|uniref:VOC family protein n=1 Tax=Nocardiopsis sp. NPDC101807 TaxID=3364339 RepID=UPI0038041B0B
MLVRPVPEAALRLPFHRVPEPKSAENRVHLAPWAEDVEAEAGRLVRPGATRRVRIEDWVATADPEGNEFDVLPAE